MRITLFPGSLIDTNKHSSNDENDEYYCYRPREKKVQITHVFTMKLLSLM